MTSASFQSKGIRSAPTVASSSPSSSSRESKFDFRERTLDAPPPLTLAQRLNLVAAPPIALSEADWKTVRTQSQTRSDAKQPCPICREDFGLKEQVLLSCSHMFHRVCLSAFELYVGRSSCPLCRATDYQKRLVHDGSKEHLHRCAALIQVLMVFGFSSFLTNIPLSLSSARASSSSPSS